MKKIILFLPNLINRIIEKIRFKADMASFKDAMRDNRVIFDPPEAFQRSESKYYTLSEEEVRSRAYKLFIESGCQQGHDEENWYNAIAQLFAEYEAQGFIVLWAG